MKRNTFKYIIIGLTILALLGLAILGYFIGISPSKELKKELEKRVLSYETDITDSIEHIKTAEKFKAFLINWADEKGVECRYDKEGNVIMHREASSLFTDAAPTILVCSYDISDLNSAVDPLTMAFSALKVNKEMGDLTVIITSDEGRAFSGAKTLDPSYFPDNANVFTLSQGNKHMYSLNSGGSSSYMFTRSLSYEKPKGTKAYRINISGAPGGFPDTRISYYPNPVNELGKLLAKFQGSSLIFDLAEIQGGSNSNVYPTSATALITMDEDNVERFIAKMDTYIKNFTDEYGKDYPNVIVTYSEAEMPENVISKSDANPLYSLLYTLNHGVYYKNEDGDVVSISSVNYFSTGDDRLQIGTSASSLTDSNLKEIDTAFETLSGLSEFTFEKTASSMFWSSTESQLSDIFALAYKSFTGRAIEYVDSVPATLAPIIAEKNPDIRIINITTNPDYVLQDVGSLVTLMTIPGNK